MSEVSAGHIQTTALDHLGLVAAICQDLKIAQRIDSRLPCDSQRKVSPGRAVVAMILNGLGFTNRRLYLTDQFFESKAIERLLGADLNAKDITDYTLGYALDDIAEYGSSKLCKKRRASGACPTARPCGPVLGLILLCQIASSMGGCIKYYPPRLRSSVVRFCCAI
jgi:hypothetical protein